MNGNVLLLYDGKEFPQAVQYAQIFSVKAADLRMKLRYKEIFPSHSDYTKVYVAVKDEKPFEEIIRNHRAKFTVEVFNDTPDYSNDCPYKKARELAASGLVNAFDDLKAQRAAAAEKARLLAEKEAEAARIRAEKEAEAARLMELEKQGIFADPAPAVPLDPCITKPMAKQTLRRRK